MVTEAHDQSLTSLLNDLNAVASPSRYFLLSFTFLLHFLVNKNILIQIQSLKDNLKGYNLTT